MPIGSPVVLGLGGPGTVRGGSSRRDHENVGVDGAITEWDICPGWIMVIFKVGRPGEIEIQQVALTAISHMHAQAPTWMDTEIESQITERNSNIDSTEHVHNGVGTQYMSGAKLRSLLAAGFNSESPIDGGWEGGILVPYMST